MISVLFCSIYMYLQNICLDVL